MTVSLADDVNDIFAEAANNPGRVERDLFTLARVDAFRHDFKEDRIIVSGYQQYYGIQRRSRWDRQDEEEARAWINRQRRIAKAAKRATAKWRKNRIERAALVMSRSEPYRGRPVDLSSIKQRRLSAEVVRAIRQSYARGFRGFVKLGRQYGVSGAMISNIVHFDMYRDVR